MISDTFSGNFFVLEYLLFGFILTLPSSYGLLYFKKLVGRKIANRNKLIINSDITITKCVFFASTFTSIKIFQL